MEQSSVILGQCLPVMQSMASGSFDAIITDPPYATDLNPESCGWDVWPETETWAECHRLLKPNGGLAITMSPHLVFERVPTILAAGFVVKEFGCWLYPSGRPVHASRLKRCWDAVIFFGKRGQKFNMRTDSSRGENITEGVVKNGSPALGGLYRECKKRSDWSGGRGYFPANVMCEASDELPLNMANIFAVKRARGVSETGDNARHPTQKPVELMAQMVRLLCPPGGRVLDPFAGSGTTCIGAIEVGAVGIGIEQSSEYHAIATRRILNALGRERGAGEPNDDTNAGSVGLSLVANDSPVATVVNSKSPRYRILGDLGKVQYVLFDGLSGDSKPVRSNVNPDVIDSVGVK